MTRSIHKNMLCIQMPENTENQQNDLTTIIRCRNLTKSLHGDLPRARAIFVLSNKNTRVASDALSFFEDIAPYAVITKGGFTNHSFKPYLTGNSFLHSLDEWDKHASFLIALGHKKDFQKSLNMPNADLPNSCLISSQNWANIINGYGEVHAIQDKENTEIPETLKNKKVFFMGKKTTFMDIFNTSKDTHIIQAATFKMAEHMDPSRKYNIARL